MDNKSKLKSGNLFLPNPKSSEKVVKQVEDNKENLPIPIGSKESLTKSKEFFMPGAAFAHPTRIAKVHRSQLSEGGKPGLRMYSGHVTEEYLPMLVGKKGVEVYEQMRRDDPIVGALLLAAERLIFNAQVHIKPNKQNPEAQESLMAKELVQTSLDDMGNSWGAVLGEILTFLPFGWSYCSVWHTKREGYKRNKWKSSRYTDGKYGWAGISLRGQSTLATDGWPTNKQGRIVGMTQMGPPNWERVIIPLSNGAHFRTKTEKENPEGTSILRNAYRPWYFKWQLEESEALGVGKDLTGTVVITTPEGLDLWNTNDGNAAANLARAQDMASLSRLDPYSGFVLPFGWDIKVLTTPGQRAQNADKIISRWDQRIAVTLLADMLLIGHENVGSFALVQSKSKLFSSCLEGYAAEIAGVFNRDLIPRLMRMNAIEQDFWPTMGFGQVDTPDLKEFSEYLTALSGVGINIDESIALYARHVGHLPPPDEGDTAVKTIEQQLEEDEERFTAELEHQEKRMEINQKFAPPEAAGEAKPFTGNKKQPNPKDAQGGDPKEKPDANAQKAIIIENTPIAKYSVGLE